MARTTTSSNGTASKKKSTTASPNGSAKTSRTAKTSSKKGEKTLEDLFEEGLLDIYNAETQLIDALPEMAKAAESEDLEDAFNTHLQETRRQVERLEKIFDRLGIDKNQAETCKAMEGLVKENKKVIEEFDRSPVRDSALIIGAQKVEHYEIASYGSLVELADVLGYEKIADILDRTLQEEGDTDKHLSSIAQDVNDEACEMSYESESEEEEEEEEYMV
jgi:ferritin-like metal-binding protein YciE